MCYEIFCFKIKQRDQTCVPVSLMFVVRYCWVKRM